MFGLTVVGCRIAFAKVPDRVPPYRLAGTALAAIAIGLAIAGTVTSVAGLFVGAALLGVGVAFVTPAFFAAVMARVPMRPESLPRSSWRRSCPQPEPCSRSSRHVGYRRWTQHEPGVNVASG